MATIPHCLCCFESLAAHLEKRKPLTLAEIQKSWAEYVRANEVEASSSEKATKQAPALRRLAEESSSSSSSSASNSTLSLDSSTPATSVSTTPAPASDEDEEKEDEVTESPLFVTWNINHPRYGWTLRGCIGTFEAQPLDQGLSDYALISALEDTRFNPISKAELPHLQVAVTLLTDFEDAADAFDWELGKHGLRISFVDRGRRYGATYLPDVAVEQGWTKEETVVSLMRKAGWGGRKDKWQEVEMKVVRYQGKKNKLEYAEFKKWRDWVEKQGAN